MIFAHHVRRVPTRNTRRGDPGLASPAQASPESAMLFASRGCPPCGTMAAMTKTRARRDEPPPDPDQLVLRGVLGGTGLDQADLRQAAVINYELYGFYGVSVWVVSAAYPRELLECIKLIKFERYAEFTVAGLAGRGLALWATGQRPHYDVVYRDDDLESLAARLAAVPHRIRDNPSVDREEH
jgi:hypothetical protein